MQQDARAVADHPEVPVPGGVVGAEGDLAREAASSGAGNAGGHGAAGSESDEEEDIEEAQTEESERVVAPVGNAGQEDAPGSAQNEDHEVPENPAAIHFELRGFRPARRAIAHAMPPSSYRRLPLRGRKRPNPTRSIVVGDAASGVSFSNAYDPGTSEAASGPPPSASLGSPSATSRSAGVSAMANAGNGDSNEALGSTARRSGNVLDPECLRSWMSLPFILSNASARDGRRGWQVESRRSQERHRREGRRSGGGVLVTPSTFSRQEAAPPRPIHLRLRGSRVRRPRQGSSEQHCSGQVPHVIGPRRADRAEAGVGEEEHHGRQRPRPGAERQRCPEDGVRWRSRRA
ncbi:hypothetical protein SEVIR_5G088200v4 [Setaria viridis]